MRRFVLRVQRKSSSKSLRSQAQRRLILLRPTAQRRRLPGISQTQLIPHFVIFGEIQSAPDNLRVTILQNTAKFPNRLVKQTILPVRQRAQPRQSPTRRRRIKHRSPPQRLNRLPHPPFLQINPRQIQRTFRPAQFLYHSKGAFSLPQLPLPAAVLQQQANSIIIPPLPLGNRIALVNLRRRLFPIGRSYRQHHSIFGNKRNGQRINKARAVNMLHVGCVKLPIIQPSPQFYGTPMIWRHLKTIMQHIRRAGRNLMIVERSKNILSIAPINSIPFPV